MSIRKTEDGRWRVQVDVGVTYDGKRDRRTRTFRTKREATAQEADWIDERDRMRGRFTRMTLGDFVARRWWPSKERTLSPTSLVSYEQDLRLRVLPAFGHVEMDRIDRRAVQDMIDGCATYSTAKRARDLLRAILNDAIDCGAAATNPAAGRFNMPRKKVKPAYEDGGAWLTTFAEHRAVLEAARGAGEVEKLLILGLCFGLRKEESLGLSVRDLDFDRRILRVRYAYVQVTGGNELKRTKTPESERDLPMSDYAFERLSELVNGMEPDAPVCVARDGRRLSPSTAGKQLRRWVERNDQPKITIKSLRHSFASACIDAGVDIAKVSAWLGHTNITTTLTRYVKTRRKDLDAVTDLLNAGK